MFARVPEAPGSPHGRFPNREADREDWWRPNHFFYFVSGDTVFFTLLYAKIELENLTHDQEKELKRLAQAIEGRA